jgi:zinc transporter 1/2/3
MSSRALTAVLVLCLLSASPFAAVSAQTEPQAPPADGACGGPAVGGKCHSVASALRLKLIAIPSILLASVLGVCLPLFSRSVPALRPDGNLFVVVKAFASGVILGTGYMHVLPDSFNDLTSPCLPRRPWAEFPFTAFVAMLAAVFTLMVDSLMLSFHGRGRGRGKGSAAIAHHGHAHSPPPQVHCHGQGVSEATPEAAADKADDDDVEAGKAQLLRNRVIVQVTDRSRFTMAMVVFRSSLLILAYVSTSGRRCWRWASWCTRW